MNPLQGKDFESAILGLARIGAWVYTPATERLWWSDEAFALHGVAPGAQPREWTVSQAAAFIEAPMRAATTGKLAAAFAARAAFDLEFPIKTAAGKSVVLRMTGQPIRRDGSDYVMGSLQEVPDS